MCIRDRDEDALVKMADHKADFVSKWNKYWQEAIDSHKAGKVTKVPEVPQIVINEYATGYDCGIPGRLVNWVARLEDNGLYGCLPFWHQANDLNDLAAEANEGNGAWWTFKWYGDMSGERLAVSSSAYYDELYGLAAIDDEKGSAKVLFGGQDGSSSIQLKNLNKTDLFKNAEYVHIKVEAANFVGMEGAESVSYTHLNPGDGKRVLSNRRSGRIRKSKKLFYLSVCMHRQIFSIFTIFLIITIIVSIRLSLIHI